MIKGPNLKLLCIQYQNQTAVANITLVNVYVDSVVFTRIAGTS